MAHQPQFPNSSTSTFLTPKTKNLGVTIDSKDTTIEATETFVCKLYTKDTTTGQTTDSLWYWSFCQKGQKNESLPPTSDSLTQHIMRSNYQAYIWKKALCAFLNLPTPEGHGWEIMEGILRPDRKSVV